MSRLEIRLLGKPSVLFDGRPWPWNVSPRCTSLLALLAFAHPSAAQRSALASALWPDELDADARANLRRHLHQLHRSLPEIDGIDWIVADARSLRWNAGAPLWLDVHAFEAAAADPARRTEAIALYRGDLLEGSFEEAVLAERERLRLLYIETCREAAIDARQARAFPDAIRFVDCILALDEWREDALRLGMSIRYESGDRSSALALFERFSSRLADEMGVEPMPETLALRDAILTNAPLPGAHAEAKRGADGAATTAGLPFVGRSEEMATLDAAWRHAARGRGTTLWVGGVAGIGKSRLAAEFAASVGAQGGRVLFGETSHPEAYPYEPIVTALRNGLALLLKSPLETPALSALAEIVPELHARYPDLPEPVALAPEKARRRLLDAIARTMEALARTRPLLLVLEDLQWAQAGTLEVVEALASRIGAVPALLLVTHRTGETTPGHPLHALRTRLHKERLASSLALEPLQAHDVKALLGGALSAETSSGGVADAIVARSAGNPLFAGQLLRSYEETGELRDAGVTRTILDRFAPLDAAVMNVARTAAAIGGSFSIDLVSETLGWAEGETFDALGSLLDRGLVRASASWAYSFSFAHALIESVVYDAIPKDERTLRHRRVAQVLAQKEGTEPQMLASIARHWKLGGERARAASAYVRAAGSALTVYARGEAIELARAALDCGLEPQERFSTLLTISKASRAFAPPATWKRDLDSLADAANALGDEERFSAGEELVRYFSQIGDRDAQRATIEEMLALADRLGRSELRCKALEELGSLDFQQGRLASAASRLDEALAIATAAGDDASEVRVRDLSVRVGLRQNDYAAVERHLDVLRALADKTGSAESRIRLLEATHCVAMETDDAVRCRDVGAQLLDIAQAAGDSKLELLARAALSHGAVRLGSMREMREHLDLAIACCERFGYAEGAVGFRLNRALFEFHVGHARPALEMLDRLVPALEAMGADLHLCVAYFTRAEALLLLDEPAAALESARRADELARKTGAKGFIAGSLLRLGAAACATGDVPHGLEMLREAVAMRRDGAPAVRLIDALSAYLQALLDAGDATQAPSVARELESLYEAHPEAAWRPTQVLALLGRAAQIAGDDRKARAFFSRGRAIAQSEMTRLDDKPSAAAFKSLPHNRLLLTPEPSLSH